MLIIIDVASATFAAFLSSAILDAVQKTPAEMLARNPCACQVWVIGVALEQHEGQALANRWGNNGTSERFYFLGLQKSLQMVTAAMKLK